MSKITAGTAVLTGLQHESDTTGELVFETNNNVTAMVLDTNGNAVFPNDINITGEVVSGTLSSKLYFLANS